MCATIILSLTCAKKVFVSCTDKVHEVQFSAGGGGDGGSNNQELILMWSFGVAEQLQ